MLERALGQQIDKIVRLAHEGQGYHLDYDWMHESSLFEKVTGKVIYVGSASELSPLVLFPNANTYVFQDINYPNIYPALVTLEDNGILFDVKPVSQKKERGTFTFKYRGIERMLVDVGADIGKEVPKEVYKGLEAIYFFAMPYPESIRAIQKQLLPLLEIGGVFEGSYPYAGGSYEGAPPDQIGLQREGITFVKTQNLTAKEIQIILERNRRTWK